MDENIFISWSKPRAQALGNAIKGFITDVIQTARPWMSDEDIEKGVRWNNEIVKQLDRLKVGIICLTPENLESRWINFESGSLARTLGEKSCVCPYLLDLGHTDVGLPLSQFNVTVADEADTFKLVRTLNEVLNANIESDRLRRTFEKFWPALATDIERIRHLPEAKHPPKREDRDILGEILNRMQAMEQRGGMLFKVETGWPEVQSHLVNLSGKLAGEVAASTAAITVLQNGIDDPKKSQQTKDYYNQMLPKRKTELQIKQRLLNAIAELCQAREDCKGYLD